MREPFAPKATAINGWIAEAVQRGASDVHIVVGCAPTLRLHGRLTELSAPQLSALDVETALLPICPPSVLERFDREGNADFAIELNLDARPQRCRMNYFRAGPHIGACVRIIPSTIPQLEWANFPEELANRLAFMRDGLVLVSGVAGAGKSTTLAMIVNLLIQTSGYRIITVEEPVEYVFPTASGTIVTQREVGEDVDSFADGLKYGLRQDPDVILVGEIRDRETAQMALSAAETGHLVFSTLHTRDAKGAVSRYADLFPTGVQNEIRSQLSMSLRAVVSQHLLPSMLEGDQRELALEVMFNSNAIASAIRMGKIESIDNCILTGRAEGMITLDESIKRLLQAGRISRDTAERFVTDIRRL